MLAERLTAVTDIAQLYTARLALEPVRAAHAAEIWPQVDDERMWQFFPEKRPAGLDALRRLYQKWERGSASADEVWCNWLCRERATSTLVASMQATVFPARRLSYIAYATYPSHQRKGFGTEAARAVIDYIAEAFGVERFWAEMDARNEPSYRLAEAIGFSRIETRAGEYLYELSRCRKRPT